MNNAVNDCIGISEGFKAIANKHNIPLKSLKNSLKKIKQNINDMDLNDADNDIQDNNSISQIIKPVLDIKPEHINDVMMFA